jgi:ferredoxin
MAECPAEAISEGDIYAIDAEKCIDCGACAGSCPVNAIAEA